MSKAKAKRKGGTKSTSVAQKPGRRSAKRHKPKAVTPKAEAGHGGGEIEVIARGCLVERSHVLLCRNLKHGYLYLPGGHVEFGESAAGALAREFLEESGLRVQVGALALVSEGAFATRKREHHELNLVFHVERPGGRVDGKGSPPVVPSKEEGIDFQWVDLAAVVDQDLRPAATKAWLVSASGAAGGTPEWVSEMGVRNG